MARKSEAKRQPGPKPTPKPKPKAKPAPKAAPAPAAAAGRSIAKALHRIKARGGSCPTRGRPTNRRAGCGFPIARILGAFDRRAFTGAWSWRCSPSRW